MKCYKHTFNPVKFWILSFWRDYKGVCHTLAMFLSWQIAVYVSFILCKILPIQAYKGDEALTMSTIVFGNLKWELLLLIQDMISKPTIVLLYVYSSVKETVSIFNSERQSFSGNTTYCSIYKNQLELHKERFI